MTTSQSERFEEQFRRSAEQVERAIEGYVQHDPMPEILLEAMLYSVRAGGKRLRPIMVLLSAKACGGDEIVALPAAAAIEMVHTYSLIHDDLPAMDDDDLRRGQPTNHRVYGDGMAILAGDALLTFAFDTLARHVREDRLVRAMILELARASGGAGMIGGQVGDLQHENKQGDLEAVEYIHTHKTAMMFRAAARMGGLAADGSKQQLDWLSDYGLKLGLAFQIVDDLLDVLGSSHDMGKQTQKDGESGKLTFPGILGVKGSQEYARRYLEEALESLKGFGDEAEPLRYLARKLEKRTS